MSKYKVKLNKAGVRQLLYSKEIEDTLVGYANQKQQKLGPNYNVQTRQGVSRTVAIISTHKKEAIQDNLDNNTMLKVMGERG